MEFQAACVLLFNIIGGQKLTIQEHEQVRAAFYQVAPKCEEALKEAAKKAEKKK